MKTENEVRDAIYSKRLQCGAKTYFFDLRDTKSGDKYLQITESRKLGENGERRTDIAIFEEYFKDFREMLEQMTIK